MSGATNKVINPSHYRVHIEGREIQAADVMEAFFPQNMHLSQAFKYMARAGKKPDSSYLQDISKALWWLARGVLFAGGTIDLPPQAKLQLITVDGQPISESPRKSRASKAK